MGLGERQGEGEGSLYPGGIKERKYLPHTHCKVNLESTGQAFFYKGQQLNCTKLFLGAGVLLTVSSRGRVIYNTVAHKLTLRDFVRSSSSLLHYDSL